MRVDVIMPQMGESIAEGTLTRWLKKVGDRVARDEPIFEISTDKVDAEIPAPAAGSLVEIQVGEGQTVAVNTIVAFIETEATAAASAPKPSAAGRSTAPAGAPSRAPEAPRPSGPAPAAATPATARPASPAAGPLPAATGEIPRAAQMAASGAGPEELRRVRSSPVVRRIAREHHVDIGRLQGTGIGGRVTKKDILTALERGGGAGAAAGAGGPGMGTTGTAAPAGPAVHRPAFALGDRTAVEPLSAMRKKIAEHMVLSRRTSAHVTTVFEVDMHRVMRLREEHRQAFESRHGIKLTPTAFFVKAAVEALKAFPVVNSSIEGDNVVYRKDIHVGVAVALDWGLIVPVIKNAGDRTLSGLAKAIVDLADRARGRKLQPDDVQGGTFTITNPGSYGALFGTPIISQPQVAIMGVGSIAKRVVVVDDAIAVHPTVHLSLSFDHRLIDGAVADQFMAHIKTALEEARFPEVL